MGYNTRECILDCLNSIYNIECDVSYEVIVVDNDSSDQSEEVIVKQYTKVQWINMGYNSGFSRANNAGLKKAEGEFVMLLNPDTVVKAGFFRQLVDFYENNDAELKLGLVGCRIKTIDGKELLVGSRRGFPGIGKQLLANPFFYKLNNTFKLIKPVNYTPAEMHEKNHEVDYLSGACLIINRSKITDNNLFMDEDFFLYSEDIDWSYRVQKAGFHNYFCAESEVYHINSGSTSSMKEGKFLQIMLSRLLLIYKCYGSMYFLSYCGLIKLNQFTFKVFKLFGLKVIPNRDHDLMNKVISEKFGIVWRKYVLSSKETEYLKYD